jgi:beta-lactamase class A
VWQEFPDTGRKQLAIACIVYDPPVIVNTGGAISHEEFWKHAPRGFTYRGNERLYPASLIKLFYLVAVQEWLESGMLPENEELNRAIRDMIVDSSNDATSLVVDVLSGTTSGPEIPPDPFETWKHQRNIVNRYFKSLGWEELEPINVNQKTWCDGPYGRERAFLGELRENRNMLTANAVSRLLHAIVGGIAVSSRRSQEMMALMNRSPEPSARESEGEENQVRGFIGEGLPANSQFWSKAGWTSQVRHDAAYIEIPEHLPYLLVIFTEGNEKKVARSLLPFISRQIVAGIEKLA